MRRALRLVFLAVLLPLAASAQEVRGNISGTVRDSEGVVPGASVKIRNVDTNVSQNLVTNSSGYYEAPLLNPGNYEVTVQVPGFKTATRSSIVLGVGQQVNVPFTLEVGGVTEEVKVTAESAAARHQHGLVGGQLRPASAWKRCRCSRTCRSCSRASRRG